MSNSMNLFVDCYDKLCNIIIKMLQSYKVTNLLVKRELYITLLMLKNN